MPLTDAEIRGIRPSMKVQRRFDGGGLYLEVAPAGGLWWRLKYRFGGKEKRLSLGVYPEVSLREARSKRDGLRTLLRDGIDPGVDRKLRTSAQLQESLNSFEVVAREWFAAYSKEWAESHSTRVIRMLERDVFPWAGTVMIQDLGSQEILTVVRRIEQRGALETAHRAVRVIGQIFRYAGATGRVRSDPTSLLRGALPPVKEGHFPAITDPVRLGVVLRMLDSYRGTPAVSSALRLAPLLFVRPGELRHARWSDIDLDRAEWRFVASKTKTAHVVPLSRQALAILRELKPLTGKREFVFPSARSGGRPMSDAALGAAMCSLGLDRSEQSVHGWRATARTMLDEVLQVRPDLIEHQLAHAVRDPNGRAYNRASFLAERRDMMQKWADYLDNLKTEATSARSAA